MLPFLTAHLHSLCSTLVIYFGKSLSWSHWLACRDQFGLRSLNSVTNLLALALSPQAIAWLCRPWPAPMTFAMKEQCWLRLACGTLQLLQWPSKKFMCMTSHHSKLGVNNVANSKSRKKQTHQQAVSMPAHWWWPSCFRWLGPFYSNQITNNQWQLPPEANEQLY